MKINPTADHVLVKRGGDAVLFGTYSGVEAPGMVDRVMLRESDVMATIVE